MPAAVENVLSTYLVPLPASLSLSRPFQNSKGIKTKDGQDNGMQECVGWGDGEMSSWQPGWEASEARRERMFRAPGRVYLHTRVDVTEGSANDPTRVCPCRRGRICN